MGELEPVESLRAALSELLPRDLGPQILFEALRPLPHLPRSLEEVQELVHGELTAALVRRVGRERGEKLGEHIAARLSDGGRRPRDADATRSMPTVRHAVPVLVVAETPRFADKLTAALGDKRVLTLPCASLDDIERTLGKREPSLVVIDASNFAAIEPTQLARALSRLRPSCPRVVWAASLPYGRAALSVLPGAVSLEIDEGVEPLLDLVRSRLER